MYNENRVNQVISAIKANGLHAMDDDNFARLLTILSPLELDSFEIMAYQELGGLEAMQRVIKIKPMVRVLVEQEMYRIRKSDIYKYYIESLKNGRYLEFFKTLSVEELGDLKKYITFSMDDKNEVRKRAADKVIKMLTREITAKDTSRKPTMNSN